MKAVLQRVSSASVRIYASAFAADPHTVNSIERGLAVLLGVAQGDDESCADRLVDKMVGLRIFADDQARMNLDIRQAAGSFLVVSQFTLLADTRKGRRPSFIRAGDPQTGAALYRYVVERLRHQGFTVAEGEFGAHMVLEVHNDGPVTIILDTNES